MRLSFQILSGTCCLSFIRGLIHSLDLPPSAARRCAASLIEAVDNAIFHAHGGDCRKVIGIDIDVEGKMVEMKVKDMGRGFDLDEVAEPLLSRTGGRGVYIMKSLMDSVEYRGNVLKMEYRFT